MDSFNDALIDCVKACGGSARVSKLLWPEKTEKDAQRSLLDALNEDRPAKLSPDQVLFLLRLSRQKGYHGGIDYINQDLGYRPAVAIEPKDEMADLMAKFNEAIAQQSEYVSRIEQAASRIQLVGRSV